MPWGPDYPLNTARGNTCYLCGCGRRRDESGKDELIYDPNRLIEFEGWLCICESCIRDIAHQLGMLSDRQHDRLKETIQDLEQRLFESQVRSQAAEDAVDAVTRYRRLTTPEVPDVAVPNDTDVLEFPSVDDVPAESGEQVRRRGRR